MQFDFDDDLVAVRELAEKIFTEQAPASRVRQVEQSGGFDAALWRTLADAGLLGIAIPEKHGGAGLGMLGLAAFLEQQGRKVAPVPLWSVLAAAALPIAQFGSDRQRDRWLPGLLDGSLIVTGAFAAPPGEPAVVNADADGTGWRLTGEIPAVAAGMEAAGFVLPVRLPQGKTQVLLLPADQPGLSRVPVSVTDQLGAAQVTVHDTIAGPADVLDGAGIDVAAWTLRRARVALAALSIGVCSEALAMTADYTSHRVQFGRPLSTNQGVTNRAADSYLDTQNIRLTTHRAASLLDQGRESEGHAAALVAKWWAARGGLRVVHATQHLHGGIGADVDYPIHRYFLWGRQIAFSLGSAAAIEAELGDALADVATIG
jgi:alkylation response protein AidB-like acyl-CoA dehydrogenase